MPEAAVLWYRDRAALRLIALGYLPWLAALNLTWEVAHLPLYTLWKEAEPAYIAFSVAHCTLGDVLIGAAALLAALITGREGALAEWRWLAQWLVVPPLALYLAGRTRRPSCGSPYGLSSRPPGGGAPGL